MPKKVTGFEKSIKQLAPISDFSSDLQNQLMEVVQILDYQQEQFIFNQGDTDNYVYYILKGELELSDDSSVRRTIVGGSDEARFAIAKLQPRQFSAKSKTLVVMLQLLKDDLDKFILRCENDGDMDVVDTVTEMEVSNIDDEDSDDWMTRVLQLEWFAELPMANIQRLFALWEPVSLKAGEIAINQGEVGNYYYLIQEGRCEVLRQTDVGKKPIKVAELSPGQCFGEEALMINATRNATVRMLDDSVLLKLLKDSFFELIKVPLLQPISFEQAKKMIATGSQCIDVRRLKEYNESHHIDGSVNIPLEMIHSKIQQLDKDKSYITCCGNGDKGSVAAFLLKQNGFNVFYIEHGIEPADSRSGQSAPQQRAELAKQDAERKERKKQRARLLVKRAELSVKRAERKKQQTELVNREAKQKKQQTELLVKRAERKKQQIELVKRVVKQKKQDTELVRREAELVKREAEQKKQQAEITQQMAEAKVKAEESYRNIELHMQQEKKKISMITSKVMETIKQERLEITQQAVQTTHELDEAKNLKALLIKERQGLRDEIDQQHEQYAQLENRTESDEDKLSEKGRVAVKHETEEMPEESNKAQLEKEMAYHDLLQREKGVLEEAGQQINTRMNAIQKLKEHAEAVEISLKEELFSKEEQVERLAIGKDPDVLAENIGKLALKLDEVRRLLKEANVEEENIKIEKKENEEGLLRRKSGEKKLNEKMQAELDEWIKQEGEVIDKQSENVKQVKKNDAEQTESTSAGALSYDVEKATEELFRDILGDIRDRDYRH